MTLLFPSRGSFPKDCSLCYSSTHVASSIDNHLMVLKRKDESYVFDFSIELPDKCLSKLQFNDDEYHEMMYLAVFSNISIIIINVFKKRIIATFPAHCSHLLWDLVQPLSIYTCVDNCILQHSVIELSNDPNVKANLTTDFSFKLDTNVVKMVIPPLEPNTLFVLTEDGTIYCFSRTNNYKKTSLTRKFTLGDVSKVVDISPTLTKFLVITTESSVCFYHMFNFQLSCVVSISGEFDTFSRAFVPKNDQFKIITLSQSRSLGQWYFDELKSEFVGSQNTYNFSTKLSEHVETICQTDDGFIFLSDKYRLTYLSIVNKRIVVNNVIQLPILSSEKIVAANGAMCAFVNPGESLEITEKGNITTQIVTDSNIIGVAYPTPSCLMYITKKALFSLSPKPVLMHKAILQNSYFPDRINFTEIKESGGFVAVRIGDERIFVINAKNNLINELFFFENLTFYDILDDKSETFLLTVCTKRRQIQVVNMNHDVIATFNVNYSDYMCLIRFNSPLKDYSKKEKKLAILKSNGYIVFSDNENIPQYFLSNCTSAVFNSKTNILVISTDKVIKVYNIQSDEQPREMHVFQEPFCQILSFDGFIITLLTKKNAVKQYSLGKFSSNSVESLELQWPDVLFMNKDMSRKLLVMEASVLENADQEVDDVSDIRYFISKKQHAVKLSKGESTKRLFRGLLMSMKGKKCTEEQKKIFQRCAKAWEDQGLYMDAAIIYHYLDDYKNAGRCLFNKQSYELCYYYSMEHNDKESARLCAAKYAFMKAGKGAVTEAVAILIAINEYHAACHILYTNQLFGKLKSAATEAIKEEKLNPSTLGLDITEVDLVPIEEIIRITSIDQSN